MRDKRICPGFSTNNSQILENVTHCHDCWELFPALPPMTRFETILIALVIVHAVLGAICLTVSQGKRKSEALRLYGLAMVTYSVAIVIAISSWIPPIIAKLLG